MTCTIPPDRVLTAKELVKFWGTPVKGIPCAVIQIVRTPALFVDISRTLLFNNPGVGRTVKSCTLASLTVNVPYDTFETVKFPEPVFTVVMLPELTFAS